MYLHDVRFFKASPLGIRHMKSIAVWISGFLLGCAVAGAAEPPVFSMMLRAFRAPLSIDGLLTAYFLPFLFAAAAAYFKQESLLLAMCFFKAFSFAYLACCCMVSLNAAWLLLPLLLFPDLYCGVLLQWMFIASALRPGKAKLAAAIPAVLTVLTACLDFFFFSPFLAAIVV